MALGRCNATNTGQVVPLLCAARMRFALELSGRALFGGLWSALELPPSDMFCATCCHVVVAPCHELATSSDLLLQSTSSLWGLVGKDDETSYGGTGRWSSAREVKSFLLPAQVIPFSPSLVPTSTTDHDCVCVIALVSMVVKARRSSTVDRLEGSTGGNLLPRS